MIAKNPNNKNKILRKKDDLKEFNRTITRFPAATYFIPLQLGFHTGLRIDLDCIDLVKGDVYVEKILVIRGNIPEFVTPKTVGSIRIIKIRKTLIAFLPLIKNSKRKIKKSTKNIILKMILYV